MKQVSENVYVKDDHSLYDGYRGCNYGFVTTSEGVVLIDSPMIPRDAIGWRNAVRHYGEIKYLINTHYHLDHITGDYFFPGTMIAHDYTKQRFTTPKEDTSPDSYGINRAAPNTDHLEYVKSYALTVDPHSEPLFENYQLIEPTVTFSDSLTLTLGDHTFELTHTPGHTPGDIGIRIPEESVYFSGDTITSKEFPAMSASNPTDWASSLSRIESFDFDHLIPGHGPTGTHDLVTEFKSFFTDCLDLVNTAIADGMTREETADALDFTELKPPLHPEPDRQRRNIEHLYEALS